MARTPDFDSKRILVVLLGGASDRSWHRQSALRARVDLINLVGRTSLREAIAVIQRARDSPSGRVPDSCISPPLCAPVISLWSATRPQPTGPYGFSILSFKERRPALLVIAGVV